ncbi:acyl-CoA dehydrogenase family protein [Herbidospora yilanensis]|uniref:acyl-CoA dehydrogenase family protein n=1 Tax=Herbidospora yilanensis TaxID=354426 RepID=UPI000780DF94|nr:acyl-CoA dehydrogenase family protein [Herbidospora yilanensis]
MTPLTEEEALAALAGIAPGIAARAAAEELSAQTFAEIRAAGLPSFVIPREYGGGGATLPAASAVIRALASADASAALILTMHYIHATRLLTPPDPPEATRDLARWLAVNEGLVNFASSEGFSGAPSRGGPIRTVAVEGPDGSWTLTGHKRYVTGSLVLDRLFVSATAGEVVRTFDVPADAPGVRIEPTWDTFGLRGTASHDVFLTEVTVPAGAVAAAYDPDPPPELIHTFGVWWSLLLASIHLGIAEAARRVALDFAAGPRSDGRPGTRAEQPRTQEHAARVELALLQARVLLADTLRRPDPPLAMATKLLVHGHASDAVDHATRLVGGASVWNDNPLARHHRDLRVALFNPPNEDVVIATIAQSVLGLDQKGPWA